MSDTSTASTPPPVFSPSGAMQGNITSSQGQPPAPPGASPLAPQSPLSTMGPPPPPTPPPNYPAINAPPMPQMPQQKKPEPAPDAKEYQKGAMEFASAMAVLGAVAGRFTRAPGGAALGAFAAALKGWQSGNLQTYENAAKKWEADTKTTLDNNRQVMEQYRQALQDRKMNIDEQMSQIQLISAKYHDQIMYDAAQSKNYTMVAQIYEKNATYTEKATEAAAKLQEKREEQKTKNEQSATYWLSPAGQGELNAVNPDGTPKYSEAQKAGVKQLIDIYSSKAVKGGETGRLVSMENSERAARGESPMTAQEEIEFNQKAKPPRSASAMSVQAFKDDFKKQHGRDPTGTEIQDFSARQAEVSSEARTKGTREANLDIILRVTNSAIPAAIEASDKVPRGQWVPLNQLIQKGQVASSDPALMQFGMANLQLAEGWARAMNPTGVMRESDRDKALSFLSTATSPETYKVLVHQLQTQIQRERAAIQSGKQSAVSPPGETPSVSESSGEGWTDLGGGVRIREKQ
jgi:hypothetical protein